MNPSQIGPLFISRYFFAISRGWENAPAFSDEDRKTMKRLVVLMKKRGEYEKIMKKFNPKWVNPKSLTALQKALALTNWTDREIADEFEVAVSTVRRWKSGVARPLPSLVKLIIKTIRGDK